MNKSLRQLIIILLFHPYKVSSTPNAVTVTRIALTSVRISWTAPSTKPAGYEVFYQTTDAENNSVATSAGNTTTTELTLTGLVLGQTYGIFVVAYESEGAPVLPSAHSNTAMITLSEFSDYKCCYYIIIQSIFCFNTSSWSSIRFVCQFRSSTAHHLQWSLPLFSLCQVDWSPGDPHCCAVQSNY